MKKCGLVIRVSTEDQANVEEGSMKTQPERLEEFIKRKNEISDEKWQEVKRYPLEGISGKVSLSDKGKLAPLFQDIKSGIVNTVITTNIDRLARNTRDFTVFFYDIIKKYNVSLCILDQNIDTTTPEGEYFIINMAAFAQLERQFMARRMVNSIKARANRGLWTGGQPFLGYDFDPNKQGNLIPNEKEKVIVNFIFDYYLKCGSIYETTAELNRQGYRPKSFTTSAKKPKGEFAYSTIHIILTNYAYIGKREINKRFRNSEKPEEQKQYKLIDAVWKQQPIVDEETFYKVQALMRKNNKSNHNVAKPIRHNYVFNGGLLYCGKCNSEMEGTSSSGKLGKKYYYYKCKNSDCKFRVTADEIEKVVINRIKQLATREDILPKLVEKTNALVQKELPQLREQKSLLEKELIKVSNTIERVINDFGDITTDNSKESVRNELDELGKRQKEIQKGIISLQLTIEEIERDAVDKNLVKLALEKMRDTFNALQPYQQKELVRDVLHKAIISKDKINLALIGNPLKAVQHYTGRPGGTRTPNQRFWRPLL